jgi:hypothetical protein
MPTHIIKYALLAVVGIIGLSRAQGGAEYVQLKAIEKWNGQLPQVSGANTPFISLTPR